MIYDRPDKYLDILLDQVENLLPVIKAYVRQQHPDIAGHWDLDFHMYGKGQTTPDGQGEIFIVGEALAPTQQLANSIASKARVGMIVRDWQLLVLDRRSKLRAPAC